MKPEEDRINVLKAKIQFGLEAGEAAEHHQPAAKTGS